MFDQDCGRGAHCTREDKGGAGRIKVGRSNERSEQKGVMQWTGTLLRDVACFRLRSGLGVRVKVRACHVVCPLDTAAVTELWRLDLFSCTSSSFLCAGMLSSRGKCFFFVVVVFFRGRFSLPACRRLLFPSLHACNKGNTRRLHAGKV